MNAVMKIFEFNKIAINARNIESLFQVDLNRDIKLQIINIRN